MKDGGAARESTLAFLRPFQGAQLDIWQPLALIMLLKHARYNRKAS